MKYILDIKKILIYLYHLDGNRQYFTYYFVRGKNRLDTYISKCKNITKRRNWEKSATLIVIILLSSCFLLFLYSYPSYSLLFFSLLSLLICLIHSLISDIKFATLFFYIPHFLSKNSFSISSHYGCR